MAVAITREPRGVHRRAHRALAELTQEAARHALMGWDLTDVIEQVRADTMTSMDMLALAAKEYRRFMALRLAGHAGLTASGLVALLWRTHVLHSGNYGQMCDATVGSYVHHLPLQPGLSAQRGTQVLWHRYTTFFGEAPNALVWEGGPFGRVSSSPSFDSDGHTDSTDPAGKTK